MKRALTVGVAAIAILAVCISGCSSDKSSTGSSATPGASATAASGTTSAALGGTSWNITLNGQAMAKGGNKVTCGRGTPISGPSRGLKTIHIEAGNGEADLTEGDPLKVDRILIKDDTGASYLYDPLQVQQHVGGGDAQVSKSGNTYEITGRIAPYRSAQGQTLKDAPPVPFEFEATCPS